MTPEHSDTTQTDKLELPPFPRFLEVASGTSAWTAAERTAKLLSNWWAIHEAEACVILAGLHDSLGQVEQVHAKLDAAMTQLQLIQNDEAYSVARDYVAALLPVPLEDLFQRLDNRAQVASPMTVFLGPQNKMDLSPDRTAQEPEHEIREASNLFPQEEMRFNENRTIRDAPIADQCADSDESEKVNVASGDSQSLVRPPLRPVWRRPTQRNVFGAAALATLLTLFLLTVMWHPHSPTSPSNFTASFHVMGATTKGSTEAYSGDSYVLPYSAKTSASHGWLIAVDDEAAVFRAMGSNSNGRISLQHEGTFDDRDCYEYFVMLLADEEIEALGSDVMTWLSSTDRRQLQAIAPNDPDYRLATQVIQRALQTAGITGVREVSVHRVRHHYNRRPLSVD